MKHKHVCRKTVNLHIVKLNRQKSRVRHHCEAGKLQYRANFKRLMASLIPEGLPLTLLLSEVKEMEQK